MKKSQQDLTLLNMSCSVNAMRFCLVYRGPLSATQSKKGKRKSERIEIRKQISPQMRRLWETHDALKMLEIDARVTNPENTFLLARSGSPFWYDQQEKFQRDDIDNIPHLSDQAVDLSGAIELKGKRFRPLVRKSLDLTCSLEILFLRQESPGSLLKKAGDIDNRIKTFIDALEMPQEDLEGDESDGMNYPLLENDTLVRGLEIDSERLLLPDTSTHYRWMLSRDSVLGCQKAFLKPLRYI